ncbi:SEC-C motif-containing protein [Halanaerobium saccharolyticum]|uniref:SEC-C motif-containing protein n=1 Tax=Halanaerobium saccharolyticum TaxID=43595 RepID=A0A4R7Z9E4_9FIRM|nr:SEC-C metal-binding domain-containing protein [Halanaerobium saccharolyticum]RAK12533.1 SEC-C motif-containing protein [Halanaerobium saccharolyticum]TDW06459.1 SEC-C motif-containing protein [Halanaerobium saccharolyticum]TDX61707.1 SEC-C motif-containing protein [Halanaerobium saccharolyticum]
MLQQNLGDYLSTLPKKELTEIRQYWQFGGISQLNKSELIEALVERIKAQLKDWLKYQLPRNIDFLARVIEKQKQKKRVKVTFKEVLPQALNNFYYRGILDLIDDEEETTVRIPVDLAAQIEEITNDSEFKKRLQKNKEIMTFVSGLLVYYGALSASEIYDFYEKYYDNSGKDVNYLYLRKLVDEIYLSTDRIERYGYYYLDPGVISPEEIIDEIEMRQNVDYYLPRKKDILYAGSNEEEKLNFVQRKFKKMLIKDFSIPEVEAEDMLWTMKLDIKNDFSTMSMLQDFAIDYEFENEKQTQKFVKQLNELHNNTRMWILKGHTPEELFEEERKHLQPLPKNERDGSVGEQTVVKGEKVGRNDPCPCGSGKKYKKCCLGKDS